MPNDDIPVKKILAAIWLGIGSLLLLGAVYLLRHLFFDVIAAVFLAVVLNVPVEWLVRRHVSRGLSIAISIVGLFLVVAGIVAAIAAPLAGQAADIAQNAPAYLRQAEEGRGPIGRLASRINAEGQLERIVPVVTDRLSELPARLVDIGAGIAASAARALIVLVIAVFAIVEGPGVVAAFERAMPDRHLPATRRIGRHVAQTVSAYTIGILALAALNGVVTAAALATMRVPFVLPLAMWAALVDVLPIIGGLLGIFVVALFAFNKSLIAGIVVVIAMFLYQRVKGSFLYPVFVGRAVQLNSLIVLLAVLGGAQIGSVAGALFAIPVAAVIHVALTEFFGPRLPWLIEEAPLHRADTAELENPPPSGPPESPDGPGVPDAP